MSDGDSGDLWRRRVRRWLPLALGLAVCVALAPLTADFVRDFFALPALYATWFVQQIFAAFPQSLMLVIFILVAAVVARLSLRRDQSLTPPTVRDVQYPGRVEQWAILAAASARGDRYARWRLAHRFALLAVETLAYQRREPMTQIRRRIDRGELELEPALRDYLRTGLTNYNPFDRPRRTLRLPWGPPPPPNISPLDYDPEQAIHFLEALSGTGDAPHDG